MDDSYLENNITNVNKEPLPQLNGGIMYKRIVLKIILSFIIALIFPRQHKEHQTVSTLFQRYLSCVPRQARGWQRGAVRLGYGREICTLFSHVGFHKFHLTNGTYLGR